MVSIESKDSLIERAKFNIPFSCIELKHGRTEDVLPSLELEKTNNIIWLDYDGKIQRTTLHDIRTVVLSSKSGDFFAITLNSLEHENLLEKIKTDVEEKFITLELRNKNISTSEVACLYRNIVYNVIKESIIDKNSGLTEEDDNYLNFLGILSFVYQDGAPMMTMGGMFVTNDDIKKEKTSFLNDFSFIRKDEEDFLVIEDPSLTTKEIIALNRLLPHNSIEEIGKQIPSLREDKIRSYVDFYLDYPNFLAIEHY